MCATLLLFGNILQFVIESLIPRHLDKILSHVLLCNTLDFAVIRHDGNSAPMVLGHSLSASVKITKEHCMTRCPDIFLHLGIETSSKIQTKLILTYMY